MLGEKRKITACCLLLGASILLPMPDASAQSQPKVSASDRRAIRNEITPELIRAVRRGMEQLLKRQKRTNSFVAEDYSVAANALMGMALLAGGLGADFHAPKTYSQEQAEAQKNTIGPQEYIAALKQNTSTILRYQKKNGYIDDGDSKMYGHGFATLYLAQLYGMSASPDTVIRKALERAIRLIERAQGKEGGWDYLPTGSGVLTSKNTNGDTSITVCQTLALRAARNLGIAVDAGVIDNAKRYIQRAQLANGGFAYRIGRGAIKDYSEFPRSAAGVCILYSLGDYTSAKMRQGILYLEKNYQKDNNFPFYAQYYCAQAMFQVGGQRWKDYFSWISGRFEKNKITGKEKWEKGELLKRQLSDGSWKAGLMERSSSVRTAMALIVLQLPYRFLPIHER